METAIFFLYLAYILQNQIYQIIIISLFMKSSEGFKIELFLNARKLKDLDIFTKSDPYVDVYFKRDLNSNLQNIGRTQTINNNLNPDWKKSFILDYYFEIPQTLAFQIMDEDEKKNDQKIGRVECSVGALVGARDQTSILTLKDKNGKDSGKLIVRVQKFSQTSNLHLEMKWKAVSLLNTDSYFDFWDKSDPYLKFLKIRKDNTYLNAAETEVIKNNLNPSWKPVKIPLDKLLSENQTRFKIQCWDQEDLKSEHHFIGEIYIQLNQLRTSKFPKQFTLQNKQKKNPGRIVLQSYRQITVPTFLDYLQGNLQLNLIAAIDFTGSNGFPQNPTSLHYLSNNFNQYQITMGSIWNIIQNYDYDKRIPSFGFGAIPKFQSFNKVSHCFPLSRSSNLIEANGFAEFMNFYVNSVQNVEFSGPTYFAPLLRQSFKIANNCKNLGSDIYQVLLILTDGEIHDMQQTIDIIVQGSILPISIIIVGVGNADFKNMQLLDGDNGLYDSHNRKCRRDLVQFVPFRSYAQNPGLLSEQVLKQLPRQVVQYMNLIQKLPNKRQKRNIDSLLINSKQVLKQGVQKHLLIKQLQQKIIPSTEYPQN